MSRNVTDTLSPWFEAAVERHADGDQVWWDLQYATLPDQQVVLVVIMWLSGAELGTVINTTMPILGPPLMREDQADQLALQMVEALREARSAQLRPGAAGTVPPGGGLLVPGR